MKLSLAVFCLINQVSAACDFNTDKTAMGFNSRAKGSIADITVSTPADNVLRIQRTGKEKVMIELSLKDGKMDEKQVMCNFKSIFAIPGPRIFLHGFVSKGALM